MNITMKHIGRGDAVEVDGNDSLEIGRLSVAGYRKVREEKTPSRRSALPGEEKTPGGRPALPGKTNEPGLQPPEAAHEDGD